MVNYKDKKDLINHLISKDKVVLDVGFWGQGVRIDDKNWAHHLIKEQAGEVYGLDIDFDISRLEPKENYLKQNAESFSFNIKFDIIFVGDLIEHLSNPGLFLESCRRNLKDDGIIIITTPNCYNLFNLAGKITRPEPIVNSDHVCYFNFRTLGRLLDKNNFTIKETGYLYTLNIKHQESLKKKFLNVLYFILSKFTSKYMETLVVVAVKR